MKSLTLLTLLVFSSIFTGFAQKNEDSLEATKNVRLVGRFKNDVVELRWYPASAAAFRQANLFGYTLQRMEMNSTSDFINLAVIKPYSSAEWKQKTNTADNLIQATIQSIEAVPANKKGVDVVELQDSEAGVFFTYILATSLSADAARGAGLMYTDKNIEAGKLYAYSISINSKEKKQAKDEALVFINDTRSSYQSPQPEDLIAEEGEGFVKLIWNNTTNHQLFSAYNIERSGDGGKTFKKINELPYMSVAENTDKLFYTDSVKNYISYLYRIKGITPWIDESDPSDFVKAMGRDKTAASPPMNTRAKGDRSKITVSWELPATSPDLKGFQVARSHNLEGPFTSINKESVSPANRMFVDEKPSPKEPYYVVYAVDTAGNYSSTFSVMANVYDTAAPSQPLGLKGLIDSNGVVNMSWKFGSDNDLVGYNIYVANGKDNIYRQITGSPLVDSVFTDTVSMRSLTKNVYYKITAVDYNNNASEYSELMVLERPDVIPPAAPLISDYAVTDNKVTLTLVGSSSDDVIDHTLIRTDASGQEIILLTAKDITTFTDEKVTEGASYSYSLVATDGAKHQTISKALQVTILEMEIKAGISKLAARANEKDKQVLLSWNLLDKKPEQTLVLFRSINGEEMKFYKKLSAEKESFTDNAEAGKYAYAIKVLYNNGAESELSETAFAEIKN